MKSDLERRFARLLNRRPVELKRGVTCVSITFDDVPMTACQLGAEILENQNARATYFVSGKYADEGHLGRFHTIEVLKELASRGHEIACHGFGHLNYQRASEKEIVEDINANRVFFHNAGLPEAKTFAYPYGAVSPSVKRICGTQHQVCRGITAGINQRIMDSGLLKAVPLCDSTWSVAKSRTVLDQVKQEGGLLVFFSHGIETGPEYYDCSPMLLESTVKTARDLGIEIKPLSEAVQFVCARD